MEPDPQPILSYVAAPDRPDSAVWRALGDGVELVVPPPAMWRQLVGPAFQLVLLAVPVGFAVAWGVLGVAEALEWRADRPAGEWVGIGFAVFVALTGLVVLAGALLVLVHTSRFGGRPAVVRVGG